MNRKKIKKMCVNVRECECVNRTVNSKKLLDCIYE